MSINENPKCPECGGLTVRKGQTDSGTGYRYKCKECAHPFSVASDIIMSRGSVEIAGGVPTSNCYNEIELNNVGNILAFGCTHLPFEHPKYLDFLLRVRDKYKCDFVVSLGDFFDSHSLSMFDPSPDGMGPLHEIQAVSKEVKRWISAFPEMHITYGNHDILPYRQAYKNGMPNYIMKSLNDIYDLPKSYTWCDRLIIDDVLYFHGTGRSGQNAAMQWLNANHRSIVMAHIHSSLGVNYSASPYDRFYAMNVGCGIDIKKYAFEYNKNFSVRPILGCSVILDNGKLPIPIPMYL